MGYFNSPEEFKDILGNFFHHLAVDPVISPKLMASKLKIRFDYSDPDLSISMDLGKDPIPILFNDQTLKPDVQMSMKADVAHRFWLGKVNLIAALTRREIVAKGPIPKILKLLPAIKPAYPLYHNYLKEKGRADLIL